MKKLILITWMLLLVTSMVFAQKSIAVSTFDITGGAVSSEEAEAITELFIFVNTFSKIFFKALTQTFWFSEYAMPLNCIYYIIYV